MGHLAQPRHRTGQRVDVARAIRIQRHERRNPAHPPPADGARAASRALAVRDPISCVTAWAGRGRPAGMTQNRTQPGAPGLGQGRHRTGTLLPDH